MANGNESRTFRTAIEFAVISIVIYVLLGAPGISSSTPSSNINDKPETSNVKTDHLVYPAKDLICPNTHSYKTHIFSTSPLVIYIDNFLSPSEVSHLISLSSSKWTTSTIFNAGVETTDDKVRKSEKAAIQRDGIVQCIEQRALAFQGWPKDTFIEKLWTQRYNVSGHYSLHYDWGSASKTSRRVSSFMVYLKGDDECVGGGTNFPRLPRPFSGEEEKEWCEFIECGERMEDGVTFKPRAGSAVFWMNFDEEGRGYKETIHAGMPVLEGQKIGLNIWSWYQAGHKPPKDQ